MTTSAAQPIDPRAPALPGRAVVRQRWSDVSFLHWRVESARVAPLLPPGVRPDEHDGSSWVGLIAFQLSGHQFLPAPPIPHLGTFAEVNVRLYSVDEAGNRAVVFRSLEARPLPAVLAARALFGLPYQWARTGIRRDGDVWRYASQRHGAHRARTRFAVEATDEHDDTPLAHFLTARWGFHERVRGRTSFFRNRHEPWQLQRGVLRDLDDELVAAAGLPGLTARPPESVLVAPRTLVTDFSLARRTASPAVDASR